MKDREEYISILEQDNEELKKDINYYKNMASRLKKENQELKKKVEVGEEQYNDLVEELNEANEKIILLQASEPMLNYKKALEETQQKEFIKYLEDEIKLYKNDIQNFSKDYNVYFSLINDLRVSKAKIEDILKKYKSITGVSNENTIK